MGAGRDDRGPLIDGDLTLRPWREDDAEAVAAACRDPLIARFIPTIPQPYTVADARDFIDAAQRAMQERSGAAFAIADAATDALLGSITRHGPRGHHAIFGYWLAPDARGRGVATRALRTLVEWTFATTDAVRLDLFTDPENLASQAVALRAGFEREGVRRAWDLDRDGRPQDCVFYVLVRGDR